MANVSKLNLVPPGGQFWQISLSHHLMASWDKSDLGVILLPIGGNWTLVPPGGQFGQNLAKLNQLPNSADGPLHISTFFLPHNYFVTANQGEVLRAFRPVSHAPQTINAAKFEP